MTSKEKAIQLVNRFKKLEIEGYDDCITMNIYDAKQCALIAVNREYDARISAYKEFEEFCPDISAQASIYAEREQLITEIENL